MSALTPPNLQTYHRHDDLSNSPNPAVNMALSQSQTAAKPKLAKPAMTPKTKTQMHRRSRTGCYTCRLRRKKCDEGTPVCTACKHLGLGCEYKRPMWWSNNEARRKHKDDIKMIIKRKKLSEKSSHSISTSIHSPPGLSHSLPTSATLSDSLDRTRSGSIESHFSGGFGFSSPPAMAEFGNLNAQLHPDFMFPGFSPYEVDVKTERQMFVNDVPTIHESTISTFSTFQSPPPPGTVLHSSDHQHQHQHQRMVAAAGAGEWARQQVFHERQESLSEETLNLNFFDFSHGPAVDSRQVALEIDDGDQRLLDHFIQFVLPTVFPILETNQHGSVASDLILPALQSNRGYLHCCLSIAAQHLKSAGVTCHPGMPGMRAPEDIDQSIMRHRYETVSTLCEALNRDENHQQILEAALGQIFFQCVVGRPDDSLPDIPWHKHFEAAISLVQKLDLPRAVADPSKPASHPPFNMTLTGWIDILGATMLGRSPTFAHTYREKLVNPEIASLGLRELMGCDDRVMYLISEIACLDALKKSGMDDITLCHHVHTLGEQIGLTEMDQDAGGPRVPYNANGTLSPKQLSRNMTAAFRLAARVYLCSLVPGFSPAQESCVGLVDRLGQVLQFVPAGGCGFDRSLVWVYLIAGSVSLPGSGFRALIQDRVAQLAEQGQYGSFGRVAALLSEVWAQMDSAAGRSSIDPPSPSPSNLSADGNDPVTADSVPYVHWRDVMQAKGWDFLLI